MVCYSTIRNVPGSYSTIQSAILACSNSDTVLVDQGTYFENINFRGRRIVVTSRYYMNNNPAVISSTIINGSTPVQPDSGSCVMFNTGEDSTTVLQGFSITGGSGTKWNDEHGAGVYREGGGILIQYSSPVIQNNFIYNNQCINLSGVTSTGGGGMRIGDSYPRIYNNVVMNNTGKYGAGIVLNFSGCIMKNNVICSNYGVTSYGGGAGIWINSNFSRPKLIENNTIVNNSAISGAGGIYSGGTVTLMNSIIWGNGAIQLQGALVVTYCDVQNGFSGTGNINSDPLFSDTNFVLKVNSPCVDAGDSGSIHNDPQDSLNPGFAKYPSRGTVRNDMGAYGGPLRRVLSSTPIGIRRTNEEVPEKFVLYQNFPNPFNPSTNIDYSIPHSNFVKLEVFDIRGRGVRTLINETQQSGSYRIQFEGSNLPSGTYFYKLTVGLITLTRKMILIK